MQIAAKLGAGGAGADDNPLKRPLEGGSGETNIIPEASRVLEL